MAEETITGRLIANKFKVTGLQRSGRMGDVYVARRIDTNAMVSIKILDPALFGEQEAKKRFEREARITLKLDHPCTLVVEEFGRTVEGWPFMALEYVDGELLAEIIEDSGCVAPSRVAYIVAQIAMALDAAHALGVIHRDMCPKNVLISEVAGQADSVKVLEFGLSRMEGPETEESSLTAVGVRIGSPFYMAPEYIEEYNLDHRADLYALGIVMFEMITGKPPFHGRPYKVMDMHLSEVPPAPSTQAADVPPWMDKLVADLLIKDPDQRVQTAVEVVRRIEKGLNQRLQTVKSKAHVPETTPVPRQRQSAPVPATDPILDRFIQQQVLQVTRGKGKVPDRRHCLIVDRIAHTSIAAAVGVRKGYLCQFPDDPVTGLRDPRLYLQPTQQRRYVFTSPDGAEQIDLTTGGGDVGVEFLRTSEHLKAFYNPKSGNPAALLELWRQGDYDVLEAVSWKTLTQQSGAAGLLNTGLFAAFLGGAKIKKRNHPALMFHGIAQVEKGEAQEGYEKIHEYKNDFSGNWGPRFKAVALYYIAREQQEKNNLDLAIDLLVQSWLDWPSEQAASRIEQLTGRRPNSHNWYGKQFPDYNLEEVDSRGRTVGLYESLQQMQDHQVMVVCMLGGYRGNAVYDDFMRRYVASIGTFYEWIGSLHVVTHRIRRDEDRSEHYVGEDLLIGTGASFKMLEDYRAFVQRAIKPPAVPTVYVVNRRGVVIHEGLLDGVELWDTLADAGRRRLERLRR